MIVLIFKNIQVINIFVFLFLNKNYTKHLFRNRRFSWKKLHYNKFSKNPFDKYPNNQLNSLRKHPKYCLLYRHIEPTNTKYSPKYFLI